jgi:hypothetical protein
MIMSEKQSWVAHRVEVARGDIASDRILYLAAMFAVTVFGLFYIANLHDAARVIEGPEAPAFVASLLDRV